MGKKIVIRSRPKITPERFKNELNEEQFAVVTHEKGPAIIIAGAGSGKTRTLTYRVAYLLENSIPPDSILLVTFTKKAAQEMIKRIEDLSGSKAKLIVAGTFHHIANVVLHRYGALIGIKNNFSILDSGDQRQLLKLVISRGIPEKETRKRYPTTRQLADIYSKRINLAITLEDSILQFYPAYSDLLKEITKLINDYDTAKRRANVMDFDDLMLYFLAFLQDEKKSRKFKTRIKHVLVDEYQDVNAIQAKIVQQLATYNDSFTVVGDDAQSIYKFRGSDFKNMLNFSDNNPGTTEIKLETNYRSTPEILNLANASINHNIHQFKKNLKTSRPSGEIPSVCPCKDLDEEADLICTLVLNHRDQEIPLEQQAVLFRARQHKQILERELIRNNIPYEVRAGLKFFEKAHIKDLISILTLIVNPSDEIQWIRALSIHKGISNAGASKIIDQFSENSNHLEEFVNTDLPDALKGRRIRKIGFEHLKNLQKFYLEHIMDVESMTILPDEKLPSLPDIMKAAINYMEPLVQENYKNDFEARLDDLKELINFTVSYKSLNAFLVDILTQFDLKGEGFKEGDIIDEEKPLILTTIHQAKGLEWKVVYVMGLLEGRFPGARSMGDPDEIEEERRLFYVASTRAKDYLYLTYPVWVPNFNRDQSIGGISRFLREIEDDNVFEYAEISNE